MRRWFALVLLFALLIPSSAMSTGSLTIPNTIFAQPTGNLSAALLDANWTAVATYVNAREVTFGLLSARPVASTAGRYYFATDVNGGTFYADTGTAWTQLASGVSGAVAQQLTGLTLANNGTATATFTIAVGAATSEDAVIANRVLISLTSGLTKNPNVAWAVGTNQGCLDLGASTTFTWYHVFLITRLDTGVVDALCSISATAPTLPTNYTKQRRIGSILTGWDTAKSIYFFSQVGDRFRWATTTQALDVNTATSGVVAVTATVSTPNGVPTLALMNVYCANTSICYVSELAATDEAPSATVAPLFSVGNDTGGGTAGQVAVMTDTARSVRYRASANLALRIVTWGWIDRRGQQ